MGGSKMVTQSTKNIASLVPMLLALSFIFQNCSNVDFENTLPVEHVLRDERCYGYDCYDAKITPEETVEKPEIKVVMVVDNSYTMTQMQDKLAAGVKNLLAGLAGYKASFSIYSTTHQTGASLLGFQYNKQAVFDRQECKMTVGGVLQDSGCIAGPRPLGSMIEEMTHIQLAPSLIDPSIFKIDENSQPEDITELSERLGDEIRKIGIHGSPEERGICTLVKTVFDESDSRPFKSQDQLGVFVVISDEDDESSAQNCLSQVNKKTDCSEEDLRTKTVTETIACSTPDCRYFPVQYSVQLGSRSRILETKSFKRFQNVRNITWKTTTPQTYNHGLNYKYNVVEDGVVVSLDGSATIENSFDSCSSQCSSAHLNHINSQILPLKGTLVAGTCAVSSCTANAAPPMQTRTKNHSTAVSCSTTLDEPTCMNSLSSNEKNGYVPGSCQITSCTKGAVSTSNAYANTEVAACTPTSCSDTGLNPGNGWLLEPGSCNVSCSNSPLAAMTATRSVDQKGASAEALPSFCSDVYQSGKTIAQVLSEANQMRPVLGCSRTVGSEKYEVRTVQNTVRISPPGTPLCKAPTTKSFSYPQYRESFENEDLINAFTTKAREKLGENYFISAIIQNSPNNPACPLKQGQSVGNRYINLIQATPSGGNVASICESDYGKAAFEGVGRWTERIMKNTFVANIDSSTSEIISVWIERGGQRLTLEPSQFRVQGKNVTLTDETLLQAGDFIGYRVRPLAKRI
jgi:hypothetical protein